MASSVSLPHIEVTSSDGRGARSPAGSRGSIGAGGTSPPAGREYGTSTHAWTASPNVPKLNGASSPEDVAREHSQTTIDPLSRHILQRTQTENTIPQKLRINSTDSAIRDGPNGSITPSHDGTHDGRESMEKPRNQEGPPSKEKKKGVSFLSRIIGSKKKDTPQELPDNESEMGERRTEGMDAHVFSHPITSNGFIPHYPAPPKYIKVRTHHKKTPDFNRVFLAQELHRGGKTRSSPQGASPTSPLDNASATWSLEFSVDGRFLAAGGQDRVVRVWAVISTAEEREAHEDEEVTLDETGQPMRLHAPVFKAQPLREYVGHTADVLDLSWSKNNFLLSSSMDKTVCLWHVSRPECLCCFKHSDFVTSIAFHPRDDRFFLAGSLDSKLRLWSIPDKSVAYWNQLPDLITAVAFTPDGKTAIAGCLNGHCLFYDTDGLRYSTQIHVRSAHGRNAKGSKIAGIQTTHYPPHDLNAEVKLLVTSNDSRIRLYNFRDQSIDMKFRGNENSCSQIRASLSDDARYVICGSEDRKVYIWSTGPPEGEKKDRRPVEMFSAHAAIVTATALAPVTTRRLLGRSGDPIYDLCNPPPVTLISRTESRGSSRPPTETDKRLSDAHGAASLTAESKVKSATPAGESPAYIARSAHRDGNIIVSADYMGAIKVFRQDCAYNRRRNESWDTASTFSKRVSAGVLGRSSSVATRTSTHRRRASVSSQQHPPADRIISWRNGISSNSSLDNVFKNGDRTRSASPRKFGFPRPLPGSTPLTHSNSPTRSTSSPRDSVHHPSSGEPPTSSQPSRPTGMSAPPAVQSAPDHANPDGLMLQADGQSLAFWNVSNWNKAGNPYIRDEEGHSRRASRVKSRGSTASAASVVSAVSALSSEMDDERERQARVGDGDHDDQRTLRCRNCGSGNFKASRMRGDHGAGDAQRLVCSECGTPV
ncbi:MAG: hypothetical protein M1823_000941 [Watsoniomyces obsoletus]|nr:MAG: hypothetical protein M1823_000941 [Watsoniomyces obsoletus]